MNREEAIDILKHPNEMYQGTDGVVGYTFNPNRRNYEAFKLAIKALEQEPILNKMRAEIMDTGAYEQEVNGRTKFLEGINYCLNVIDKYKAESEGE